MEQQQFLINSFGDRYLHEVNRGAFDRLGAAAIFKQHFGDRIAAKDSLIVAIGTDSGMLVRHVQRVGVPDGTHFLFIELAELLPTIRADLADLTLDEQIHLVGPDDVNGSLRDVRFSDYANIGSIDLLDSVGATDDNFGGYRELAAEIRRQFDALLWAYNSQLSNPSFIRCQLQNLVEEHVPAEVLRDAFPGRTAVLLGGGPSLDALLPWVIEHQDELIIIAVSRICRRLRASGLTPHVVVSIDPNDLSFDVSRDFLLLDPRVLFVHANHVYSPLLTQWRGRSLFLDQRFIWHDKDKAPNVGSAGPTVGNTAFSVALAMGVEQIVLVGMDLCHSAEGFSHASGSNEHDAGPRFGFAEMRVETNNGRIAETSPDFHTAIRAFGAQAAEADRDGVRVVNPAGDGAVIDNVDFVPSDSIELQAADRDTFAALHDRLPADDAALRLHNIAAMQRDLAHVHGRLRKIIALAEEALACNDGLFGRNGKTADFKFKKRMDKIEHQLDNRLKDISQIVRSISARAFLHMPPSDREWTDEEIEQAGKTYYTAYKTNASLLLDLVEQAQARLEVAREETCDQVDWTKLLEQYEKDRWPGRVAVMRHRRPGLFEDLSPEISDRMATCAVQFDALMTEQDTGHLRRARDQAKLAPVRGKLQMLFRQRNTTELETTLRQIENREGNEAAELTILARGYLAELADLPEEAFSHYAGMIDLAREGMTGDDDASNPRLEDGLRRMVLIAMTAKRSDQALLIFDTLSSLSPAYQPQYAELLKLSGRTDDAIAVYSNYLSRAPGDLVSMLRLGRLYQTIGADEAALTAFNYVLEQDPDNETAKTLLGDAGTAA